MRVLFYTFALLALAATCVFGMIGSASAGFCDTSCPSDSALVIYNTMFVGGCGGFLLVVVWLITRRITRR
jgi:hypothetical protein